MEGIDMSKLSRRTMIAGVASAAPIAVLPTAILSKPLVTLASGPTKISQLHAEHQAARREYKAAERKRSKLQVELLKRLPKPDPSIVHSPENDADGLAYKPAGREPHTINHYIRPLDIAVELESLDARALINPPRSRNVALSPNDNSLPRLTLNEIGEMYEGLDEFDQMRVSTALRTLHDYRPLSESDLARRDRLESRLRLSKEYEQKIEQLERKLGLAQLNRKIEKRILPRLGAIERRIYAEPATTQGDLRVKLALYEAEGADELSAEKLLRDFRRIVQTKLLSTVA
jgi:hypothetical protein